MTNSYQDELELLNSGRLRRNEVPTNIKISSSRNQRPNSIPMHNLVLISSVFLVIVFGTLPFLVSGDESNKNHRAPIPNEFNLSQQHPVLIVLSYDGFRYNYFEKVDTPNMDEIGYHGVRAVMKNEFPTKTFPNHQSIVTGLHPESHGIVGNSFYDPKYGQVLHVQNQSFWNFRDDVVPIWVLNERAGGNRTSGVMTWPGGEIPYGPNKSLPTFYHGYNGSFEFESRVDMMISWIGQGANLVFGYFEEPDEVAHAWGPESNQTRDMIQRMDNLTGYFINRLKEHNIYDKVNIIMLSDHGFHSVPAKNIINITKLVDSSQYQMSGLSPVITVAPIEDDESALESLYKQFNAVSKLYNFTVYKKSEIGKNKSYWFYQNNRRIMPLILVADPGYVFDDFYNNIFKYFSKPPFNHTYSEDAIYGAHGYDNHEISMHPYFMARGPIFHSDGREVTSFHNIDLFQLFGYIAGFEVPANNGSSTAINLLVIQKKMFNFSPTGVGLLVVVAVLFGLAILSVILSFLRQGTGRKDDSRYSQLISSNSTIAGYRFVNSKGEYEDDDEDDYYEEDDTQVLLVAPPDILSEVNCNKEPNYGGRFIDVHCTDKNGKPLDEFELIQGVEEQETNSMFRTGDKKPELQHESVVESSNTSRNGNLLPNAGLKDVLEDEDVDIFHVPIPKRRVNFV